MACPSLVIADDYFDLVSGPERQVIQHDPAERVYGGFGNVDTHKVSLTKIAALFRSGGFLCESIGGFGGGNRVAAVCGTGGGSGSGVVCRCAVLRAEQAQCFRKLCFTLEPPRMLGGMIAN